VESRVGFTRLGPGRSGEGMLFLIIGFRALSRSELLTSVVIMGTCLAALTSGMNHGLLKAQNWVWMGTVFFLLAMVMFWGAANLHTPTSAEASGPPAAGYSYVQVPISIAFKSTPIKDFRFQTPESILRVRTEQVGGQHETYH
jgi:hypothetical protein